jgi:GTPase SAR1 family protein
MESQSSNLAIIGDGSVGKSSLIAAFKSDGFTLTYKQTVGCDFYEKPFSIGDRTISLRVWDMYCPLLLLLVLSHSLSLFVSHCRGGQSLNSKSLPQYLSSSQIIFIVYDVTNPESFANVDDWMRVVNEYAPTARLHLVGNKVL